MTKYIAAIDQGTTSTRCMVFDRAGQVVEIARREHRQIYPQPGWVEHDALEIWVRTQEVVQEVMGSGQVRGEEIAAIGVTNQRETTLLWDRTTGEPFGPAIVWQDIRTHEICTRLAREGGPDRFHTITGLPLSTYFSGPKIRWILDHNDEARTAALNGEALFGTIDSWLIWWLTGGPAGGAHITDVTTASRTMLMDVRRLDWDSEILTEMEIPPAILPRIVPSSDPQGWGTTTVDGPFGATIPVCGDLGDQQAALVGQACYEVGDAKNTYGTGCFMLMNTGEQPVFSRRGLLTTVAYQMGSDAPLYALEGSIAITGALVQWLRDNLGLIASAGEVEELARSVEDSGGIYFVPAFSGLFAPYWRSDARGVIVGLTRFTNKGHLARAALEATGFQTRDVLDVMVEESGASLQSLKVDGGMVVNELLMQFQADILNVPVVRPKISETTALGAAYAAGLAVGFWDGLKDLRVQWQADQRWEPSLDESSREERYAGWTRAIERSLGWAQ